MVRQIFPLLLAGMAGTLFWSCGGKKTLADAQYHYENKNFATAAGIYKSNLGDAEKGTKAEIAFKAAESFEMYNDYRNAARYYQRAEKEKYGYKATLKYAEMLKAQEMYPEAIVAFDKVLKDDPGNKAALAGKEGSEYALKWKNEKSRYVVENMKILNTKSADYSATIMKRDGIMFSSDREGGKGKDLYGWTGNSFSDIYVAPISKKRGQETIGKPELAKGNLNSKFNDGVTWLDARGSTVYFTQCNGASGKLPRCKILMSTKVGRDEWDEPIELPFNDTNYFFGHPALSADGNKLYFTSNMPGGYGGHDIWVSNYVRRGKTWSEPINLGPTINTERDEMFPTTGLGDTLFFSSNGHPSMGGLDIFRTIGAGSDWEKPVNMKSPINSHADDFSFTIDETRMAGYLTSNRNGGRGNDDIYAWKLTPLIFTLSGVVRDVDTREIIRNARIPMTNSTDTGTLMIETDETGSYKVILKPTTDYELFASKREAYYIDSRPEFQTTKGLTESTDLIQDFYLKRLDIEGMFDVKGILYDLDKANIRPDAAKILDDSVIFFLRLFPRISIELGSHTDCRADSVYNIGLSQRRADSAVAYIIRQGIDSNRLTAKGYGENMLLIEKCKCDLSDYKKICTEAEHQLNRRTTVKVISTNYLSKEETQRMEEERKRREAPKAPEAAPPKTKDERDLERQQKLDERNKRMEEMKKERERKLKERQEKMEQMKKEREQKQKEMQEKQKK